MTTNRVATSDDCIVTSWNACELENNNRSRSNIVLKDRGAKSQYRGMNNNREEFYTFQVDGCIVQQGRKCDFLLLDDKNKVARLIELKGLDYPHGASQIVETMKQLGKTLKGLGYNQFLGRIASSKSPHINDSEYIKLKRAVYNACQVDLVIKGNNRFDETLT
ncbi:hypothetical protein GCM10008018_72530 [Paenibacillus marchantiophytorum]|uniref:Uncharacterized protein n=1 Tax=Paenibacillus marchantiophytorum TaxID=1619310 RepID=A0ABQ1FJB7_9BACL|nr:hypothetical protein [Paenibacillus marchantiophytorum]GGA17958.1 hypothetical protein GCM10008018_72530 [Paenibacillus marchantiophytorum]